jgi:hypothetical protein
MPHASGADGRLGDMVELLSLDVQRWDIMRVVLLEELPTEPQHIPEEVAAFEPRGPADLKRLAESPEGYWCVTLEVPAGPTRQKCDDDSKAETAELESPSAIDVFILVNHGRWVCVRAASRLPLQAARPRVNFFRFGVLYDTSAQALRLWRFALVRSWPPDSRSRPVEPCDREAFLSVPYNDVLKPRGSVEKRRKRASQSNPVTATEYGGATDRRVSHERSMLGKGTDATDVFEVPV